MAISIQRHANVSKQATLLDGLDVIPLFHTGPESNELPRIDRYLDSCLNRTQFVKILTDSHSMQSVLAIRRSVGNLAQKF